MYETEREYPKVRKIQHAVAHDFGITYLALMGTSRLRHKVLARHVAMWIARKHTGYSLLDLAQAFNRVDHTTILHGVGRIERRMREDADFAARVADLVPVAVPPVPA